MKRILTLIFLAVFIISCKPERENNISNEVVINGLNADNWTYFSIETGQTIGTSTLGNADEDALWAARKDWDFAICGDLIKTNSGTSGCGSGGALINTDKSFDTLIEAPASGYQTDTLILLRK